ncbi:hypothetical protein P7K49_029758, partial [Saguinus oedipus]
MPDRPRQPVPSPNHRMPREPRGSRQDPRPSQPRPRPPRSATPLESYAALTR